MYILFFFVENLPIVLRWCIRRAVLFQLHFVVCGAVMKQPFNRTIQITNEKNRNEILYIYTVVHVDILLKKKKWNVPFFHITHVSFTQRTNVLLFSTRLLLEISLDCRFEMLLFLTRYAFNQSHRRWCFVWFLYDDDRMKREKEERNYKTSKTNQRTFSHVFCWWKIKVFVEHFN